MSATKDGGEPVSNNVEIALQTLAWRQPRVVERLRDELFDLVEISIEHLESEGFLRPEMIGERALGRRGLGDDVAHAGADIAFAEHDLETGVQNAVAVGCFCQGGGFCANSNDKAPLRPHPFRHVRYRFDPRRHA